MTRRNAADLDAHSMMSTANGTVESSSASLSSASVRRASGASPMIARSRSENGFAAPAAREPVTRESLHLLLHPGGFGMTMIGSVL